MRSGCVNIHLKGNTQGRTREGGLFCFTLCGFLFDLKEGELGKKGGCVKGIDGDKEEGRFDVEAHRFR